MKIVVKHGGNASGEPADEALAQELAALRSDGHAVVVVHGGGPEIDRALDRRGIITRRVDGLRFTDAETLDVAESVLCATANKRLVRTFLRAGVPALGISGQDGGMIRVRRASTVSGGDLGFVGEIVSVDASPLLALLDAGYVPVVSPIAIDSRAEHAYNVNADTAAGAIAASIRADAFVAVTNVDRVLADRRDPASAFATLSIADALLFASSEACEGGMKPKILAAVSAVAGGAKRALICGAKTDAIAAALAGNATIIA